MMTELKRIIKTGLVSFWRNRWISSATIGIMVIALALITSLVVLSAVTDSVLSDLEERVDITVYFNIDTPESEIVEAQRELEAFPEVQSVEYVSRDEALERFRERHRDNPLIIQSLEELGGNPLEASLNIKAHDITDYAAIASFLEGRRFAQLIDSINYFENRLVIERLSSIITMTRRVGLILSLTLATIAVLVTFNTIRLTMYSMREEIGVMRLVGASNWYIRGPFVVEGILYGVAASVIVLLILIPIVNVISPRLVGFLPGIVIADYFYAHLWQIFLIQTAVGIGLGVLSSLIAMRRYLRI